MKDYTIDLKNTLAGLRRTESAMDKKARELWIKADRAKQRYNRMSNNNILCCFCYDDVTDAWETMSATNRAWYECDGKLNDVRLAIENIETAIKNLQDVAK